MNTLFFFFTGELSTLPLHGVSKFHAGYATSDILLNSVYNFTRLRTVARSLMETSSDMDADYFISYGHRVRFSAYSFP